MADFANSVFQFLVILWSLLKEFIKKFLPKKRKNISGKVVLITGGGGGIGRQLALKFAAENAKLALLDIDEKNCEESARQVSKLGGICKSYVCDVAKKQNVAKVAKSIREDLGEVDILVNNAGIINGKAFLDLTEDDILRIISVNLLASFWTIQEFLPEMIRRNEGHIVTVSSVVGCIGMSYTSDYASTKFALRGLSESLAEDFVVMDKNGLHISIVYPTSVDTPLIQNFPVSVDWKGVQPMSAEHAAKVIMEGILTNRKHIFVPNNLWKIDALNRLLPEETMELVRNFDNTRIRLVDQ